MQEYIVQPGDMLSVIAEKKLGKASRWVEIAKLNKIENPDLLFVGQRLKLPLPNQVSLIPNTSGTTVFGPPLPPNGNRTQIPANVALARGFMFIVFEQLPEVGSGKIIRKVAAIPRNYALKPANPLGGLSPAEHVLNTNPFQSPYLSASNRPMGAASIEGQPLLLDVAKIQKAGGQIYSVPELVRDLERFATENPSTRVTINKLISTVRNIEGEVLIKGGSPPGAAKPLGNAHTAYVRSAEDLWKQFTAKKISRPQLEQELAALEKAYSKAKVVGRVGRVLMVVGVVVTAYDLTKAANQSIKQQSFRPVGAEVIRQVGGWGGAIAGGKIGFAGGALFGIETGPGALITGAVGALIFGAAGYFGADWLADKISPN